MARLLSYKYFDQQVMRIEEDDEKAREDFDAMMRLTEYRDLRLYHLGMLETAKDDPPTDPPDTAYIRTERSVLTHVLDSLSELLPEIRNVLGTESLD